MNTQNNRVHTAQLCLSQAVFIQDQQIKTDSQKVSEAFGKNHRDVLKRITSLDCPSDFSERNFALANYIDEQGKPRPMYEMTKDGWMFLVMGFTGEKAAQIKIAFINAFNAMATLLQNQQLIEQQGIQVGTKVRLNSGSPELTVNQLMTNAEGILNHSHKPDHIALNLPQVCAAIHGLPDSKALIQELAASTYPYPHYIQHGHAVRSMIDDKTHRCIVFKQTAVQLGGVA